MFLLIIAGRHVPSYALIYFMEYLSTGIQIVYSSSITLHSINKVQLSSLTSFLFLNIGSRAILIGPKAFIAISIAVGNTIDIHTFGSIAALTYRLWHSRIFGIIVSSSLSHPFPTKIELFPLISFIPEPFPAISQSITSPNRIPINSPAGPISIASSPIALILVFIYYLIIGSLIRLFPSPVYGLEIPNPLIRFYYSLSYFN